MEWIETTGSSLDEAKERALDRLGVAEDELEVEVLSEPTRSMFGLKKSEARLRARVRPTSPRPKVERRDRNRRNDRKGGKGRSSSGRQDQQGGRGSRDTRQGPSGEADEGDGNRRRRGNDRQPARQQEQVASSAGRDGDDGQGTGKPDRRRDNGRQSASRESSDFRKSGRSPIEMHHAIFHHKESLVEYGAIVKFGRKWLVSEGHLYQWLREVGPTAGRPKRPNEIRN